MNQWLYEWVGFRKAEMVSVRDRGKRVSLGPRYVWEMVSSLWREVILERERIVSSMGMKLKNFILRNEMGWCPWFSGDRD